MSDVAPLPGRTRVSGAVLTGISLSVARSIEGVQDTLGVVVDVAEPGRTQGARRGRMRSFRRWGATGAGRALRAVAGTSARWIAPQVQRRRMLYVVDGARRPFVRLRVAVTADADPGAVVRRVQEQVRGQIEILGGVAPVEIKVIIGAPAEPKRTRLPYRRTGQLAGIDPRALARVRRRIGVRGGARASERADGAGIEGGPKRAHVLKAVRETAAELEGIALAQSAAVGIEQRPGELGLHVRIVVDFGRTVPEAVSRFRRAVVARLAEESGDAQVERDGIRSGGVRIDVDVLDLNFSAEEDTVEWRDA